MTKEELFDTLKHAQISTAAGPHWNYYNGEKYLDPKLWEELRIEMQRRYRIATGETHAVLEIK